MFTELVKIKFYYCTGKIVVYYDELKSLDGWYHFCLLKMNRGYIGGFCISITNNN